MNRVLLLVGSILFVSGVILYGLIHLAIANYIPNMRGWSDPPGKFDIAMDAVIVRTPYYLSLVMMLIGFFSFILVLYREYQVSKKLEKERGSS